MVPGYANNLTVFLIFYAHLISVEIFAEFEDNLKSQDMQFIKKSIFFLNMYKNVKTNRISKREN